MPLQIKYRHPGPRKPGWLQILLCLLILAAIFSWSSLDSQVASAQTPGGGQIYLPLVALQSGQVSGGHIVNIPFFEGEIRGDEAAVFWFGKVTPAENYADVRVGYTASELYVRVQVFDRLLWYDRNPTANELTDWDALSLYIDTRGGQGNTPHPDAYRLVSQLNRGEEPRDPWQAAYRGNNTSWSASNLDFITESGWRGNYPNDNIDDRGWRLNFLVPFSSLGLSGPPAPGTHWGLGLTLHDRDAENAAPLAVKSWPPTLDPQRPLTWGKLVFGLPGYTPPAIQVGGSTTIRQGLNGAQVVDAHVGGHSICGSDYAPTFFDGWGDANYAGYAQINIQNQFDISDWPCFSKYYLTFPLEGVPGGQQVINATLLVHQFSNAGIGHEPPAPDSLIQVLTVGEDWQENTITWNNAPLGVENVSRAWVQPLNGDPAVTRTWDVSRATAAAYAAGQPLRLVLYSADIGQHSGKYFDSSDTGDWNAVNRPTLVVTWGN